MEEILTFWFSEITPKQWWIKDRELDELIRTRFKGVHDKAKVGELSHWRESARGRLAEIIVLDQFSRNMFRDTKEAFQYDPIALVLSQEAVRIGADKELSKDEKNFLYLPYMHSESLEIHEKSLELYTAAQLGENIEYEIKHKVIIERFGRYPHRNKILGRESTPEEIEFLKGPDSSF